MLDVSVSYNRYKFIGHEFLTWLWFAIENRRYVVKEVPAEPISVDIGNRMVLENRQREAVETVTIKGDEADLEEGVLALRKGALVTEMNLAYRRGEQEWRVTLKGESFHVTGLKCPATGKVETKADLEGAVLEKIFLYDEVIQLCDSLFRQFMTVRLSEAWRNQVVPEMRRWIQK